jgi:hypothetical protein
MPIRKTRPRRNFTIIANRIRDDRLLGSNERALLVDLLSRPPDWKVIPRAVQVQMKWGRDKTYQVFNNLIALGYMHRVQNRDSWTRSFLESVYTVYSDPDDNPHFAVKTAEPCPEIPLPENQDNIKRTESYKNINKQVAFKKAAMAAPARPAISRTRRNAERDALAYRLCPEDSEWGYELFPAEGTVNELLRKLASGTLTDQDLGAVKGEYLARGRRESK